MEQEENIDAYLPDAGVMRGHEKAITEQGCWIQWIGWYVVCCVTQMDNVFLYFFLAFCVDSFVRVFFLFSGLWRKSTSQKKDFVELNFVGKFSW